MSGLLKPPSRRVLRRLALVAACVAFVGAALWSVRSHLPWANAQSPADAPAPVLPPAPTTPDYVNRVVAYIYDNQPITRQELGEYLIARLGAKKLPDLLNRRIIEMACRERGIEIGAAEVEATFNEDLKGLRLDKKSFVETILARYHKNIYEWKEDVLRPKLQMTRLCRDRVRVDEAEVRKAFEANFGEKIECRMIVYPKGTEQKAHEEYGNLRDSEEAFAAAAKKQPISALAATGGKLKPFGRYAMHPDLEAAAFALRPGELTTLVPTPQGLVLLKCDRRYPPDASADLNAQRTKLTQDVFDAKVQEEMKGAFEALRQRYTPKVLLPKEPPEYGAPLLPATQVVGNIDNGNVLVTREDLGEYLIARYGVEKLDLLVNHRIIARLCKSRGVTISKKETEDAFDSDLALLKTTREIFQKEVLNRMGRNLYEWREDVVRPKLMLTKLVQGRVRCEDGDLKKCFEAKYGEKLECRMIMWPPDQHKFALAEYGKISQSEKEFEAKARSQASPSLAAEGGKIPAFGRYSLGDDNLEREAFSLQPGEVSSLVGTPQGHVVLRCEKRIPPNASVRLEQVRTDLVNDVIARKTPIEMQLAFQEARKEANPRLMLRDASRPDDLAAQARQLLGNGAPGSPPPPPR